MSILESKRKKQRYSLFSRLTHCNSGLSIRWLLVGANALTLVLPIATLLGFRLYDIYLLRQTERQLIAQAVFVGEAWRENFAEGLLQQKQATEYTEGAQPRGLDSFRPPGFEGKKYVPIAPLIDLGTAISPPQPEALMCLQANVGKWTQMAKQAAEKTRGLIKRGQVFSLSAIRILDPRGCVVASTGAEEGLSLADLYEVKDALRGKYSAVIRKRISDEPTPSINSKRRRGTTRVFSALPIFWEGQVIAVVRVSRTSLSAAKSLWLNRRGLLLFGSLCIVAMVLVSLLFSLAITRPLSRLQKHAMAVAEGERTSLFSLRPWTPREFKSLGMSLFAMTKKLQERTNYVRDYAANLTHEFKTPITAIRGAVELLQDNHQSMSEEQLQRFLNNIDNDTHRMERLVNQLLYLARIESRSLKDSASTVRVEEGIKDIVENYSQKSVPIVIEEPQELLARGGSVEVHAEYFDSVLRNLIDNALDKQSTSKVIISWLNLYHGENVLVVEDNGDPIGSEHLGHIFDRFYTTKRDKGGTGLGLALVKAIVESEWGRIGVESNDSFTRFEIRFEST